MKNSLYQIIKTDISSETKMDFHIHTNWTDGQHSVIAMYERACELDLEYLLFSEHVRKNSIEWFSDFAAQVRALPTKPCRAFVGLETRVVDFDGNIDIGKEIISLSDLVIGSVHRFMDAQGHTMPFDAFSARQALALEFRLACALLENQEIDILGHPMGMSYNRYKIAPSDEQIRILMGKARDRDIFFEISAKYHPDPKRFIQMCLQEGCGFTLGSDAHSTSELGHIVKVLGKGV